MWRATHDALDRRTLLEVSRDTGTTFALESEYRYDENFLNVKEDERTDKPTSGKIAGSGTPGPGGIVATNTVGRLTSVVKDGLGTALNPQNRLSYDVRGRVTKEELLNYNVLDSGLRSRFSVEYACGREAVRPPRPAASLDQSRNPLGQIDANGSTPALSYNGVAGIAIWTTTPGGGPTRIGFGNGLAERFENDWRGRVTAIAGTGLLRASSSTAAPPA